ncbi:MAG: hypothetical protein KUG69_05135 [Marinosulfonomonas sp.]|nr:hypothetical protein [Marinosulfonomonas sp.]
MAGSKKSQTKPEETDLVSAEVEQADFEGVAETSAATEDVADQTPAKAPVPARGGGFGVMLLGGLVAAAIGFGAAQYTGNDGWPFASGPSQTDELAALVHKQESETAALRGQLVDLTSAQSASAGQGDLNQLRADFAAVYDQVAALSAGAGRLGARITDLENRPIPEVGATADAVAAYERELSAMRQMLETELARIETAQADAIAVGKTLSQSNEVVIEKALITRVQAALDSGADFSATLGELAELGMEVPADLSAAAGGVTTLAVLQSTFPDDARTALNAAIRAQAEAGQTDRFTAFLRTQLGARSLEPKDGDGADAVLSRAEAALKSGDIDGALSELAALSDAAKSEMAGWIKAARARQAAVSAANVLANLVNE